MLNSRIEESMAYTKFAIETDADTVRKLTVLGQWMEQVVGRDLVDLFARQSLSDRYSRNAVIEYNISSIMDACLRKLLHDIENDLVDVERLQELSQTYHARARGLHYVSVSIDDAAYVELKTLLGHFNRLNILIKPISKRGVPNLKSPLNIAMLYCYEFVMKQSGN